MSARTRSTSSLSIVVALVTAVVGIVALTPRDRATTPMAGSDGLALI
ncbi:hypothetical protein [Microbacterium aoyamense]|nr:hypothetical protein [Microbacterium aoyamense]